MMRPRSDKSRNPVVACVLFAVVVFVLTPACGAAAQANRDEELGYFAARISAGLQKSFKDGPASQNVLLFRIFDKNGDFTPLGDDLTRKLSAILAAEAQGYKVTDTFSSPGAAQFDGLGPVFFERSGLGRCFQAGPTIAAIVVGKITAGRDATTLAMHILRLDQNNRRILEAKTTLPPVTDNSMSPYSLTTKSGYPAWVSQQHPPDSSDPPLMPPALTKDGYTAPHCLHCPRADYPPAAQKDRIEGKVLLRVQIDTDGFPTKIWLVRPLPACDLNTEAVETVSNWKFAAGRNSEGVPIAMESLVEVSFHLY